METTQEQENYMHASIGLSQAVLLSFSGNYAEATKFVKTIGNQIAENPGFLKFASDEKNLKKVNSLLKFLPK